MVAENNKIREQLKSKEESAYQDYRAKMDDFSRTYNNYHLSYAYDGKNIEFKVEENAKIYAPNRVSRLNCATTFFNYDFYGTYETVTLTPESNTYYMSGGELSYPKTQNIPVGSYRWYIKVTQNGDGGNYAPVFVFTEDDDATGIKLEGNAQAEESYYNLNGMRINKPANGAYIIKYSDGSVKKVAVK